MVPARLTLDPTGNWAGYVQKTSGTTGLNQSRTHNVVNETTDITETVGTAWVTPAHDRAGNMTTAPKPSSLANGLTLKYDAWSRLVEVKDGGTVVGKYEYDGLNRRIKKHLDSQSPGDPNGIDKYEHYFYNADWQVLETRETTTENDEPEDLQPKYQYVWSARYIDSPVLRDKNTDQDGLCDDQRIYYLTDANFNVTCLVDTAGDALERYLYDPYGKVTIYTGDWSETRSSSNYSNVYLYTGREYDGETRLYQYRHRYYHAELGRFLSRDPIGYQAGDVNLYRYVKNAPPAVRDPFGLTNWREKLWCWSNKACCCSARNSPATVDAELNKRYGTVVIPDDSVLNAVKHCTWMCYVTSLWACTQGQAASLGKAHESGPRNPPHLKAMDLYNNSVGTRLGVNGQSVSTCADKCEQEARAYRLYWFAPHGFANGAPNELPNDFPGFGVYAEGYAGEGVGTRSATPRTGVLTRPDPPPPRAPSSSDGHGLWPWIPFPGIPPRPFDIPPIPAFY